MRALYMGDMRTMFRNQQKKENVVADILTKLGKSGIGLHQDEAIKKTAMDGFEIEKHVSELLSPACGMTAEEKENYYKSILAKLESGKKLTPEEMRFLQAEYPEQYVQVARVQAMRDGLETRLKTCRSKEAAQVMYADALDSVAEDDPMKKYIVAAYQDVMREFEESEEYEELPSREI